MSDNTKLGFEQEQETYEDGMLRLTRNQMRARVLAWMAAGAIVALIGCMLPL